MSVVDQIGRPTPEHVAYAAELLAQMPRRLKDAAREPIGARAVVLGLLLPPDAGQRAAAIASLEQALDPPALDTLLQLLPDFGALSPPARLPLIDLALPALRRITPTQYAALRSQLTALIEADQRVDLFEWMLQRLVVRHLGPVFGGRQSANVRHHTLRPLLDSIACLLSALAAAGQREPDAARAAFDAARRYVSGAMAMRPPTACGLPAISAALDELAAASPRIKRSVLEACTACIAADRQVKPREAELLRAVADALDCPMPLLLPGRPLA